MTLAPSEYAGTWEAKDGSRTIQVQHSTAQNGGEHCFVVTNLGTGRRSRMNFTGLVNGYRKVSVETTVE